MLLCCQPSSRQGIEGDQNLRLGQGNVDSSRVKHRPTRNKDNLEHKSSKREGVLVEDQTSNVANNLKKTTQKHENHEESLAPTNTEVDVRNHGEDIENDKDGVGGQRGTILVDAPFYRAEVKGAV